MAKRKEEETTAMTTAAPQAVAIPDYIKQDDQRGKENITTADIKPAALRLAQSGSPEVKRAQPDKFIDGLREGDFFNSLTREILGEGPFYVCIINQLGHRNVEFEPGNTGKVLDFDVPDNDPRAQFTTAIVDGKRERIKPLATKFYDYLIFLIRGEGEQESVELMTMSLKSTQLKKAVVLNTLLSQSKLASFAHKWQITPVPENKGQQAWYGWKIEGVGFVSPEVYAEAERVFEMTRKAKIEVDTADDDGDASDRDETTRREKIPF